MSRCHDHSPPPIVGGQLCHRVVGRYAVHLAKACECGESEHTVQRLIAVNGSTQLRGVCIRCHSIHRQSLSQDDCDHSEFPVIADRTANAVPCERCGERGGTEQHHWAPQAVFGDEADDWPMAFLCRACHMEWHRRTGVAV